MRVPLSYHCQLVVTNPPKYFHFYFRLCPCCRSNHLHLLYVHLSDPTCLFYFLGGEELLPVPTSSYLLFSSKNMVPIGCFELTALSCGWSKAPWNVKKPLSIQFGWMRCGNSRSSTLYIVDFHFSHSFHESIVPQFFPLPFRTRT